MKSLIRQAPTTRKWRKIFFREKKNTKTESERKPTEMTIARRLTTENLDKRLIEEVAKPVREV